MDRWTQKQIRDTVRSGLAVDISNADNATRHALEEKEDYLDKIAYSEGVYGINAGLLRGHNTGTWYAITARTTALAIFF